DPAATIPDPAPAPNGGTITGTSGNDRLYGTSEDDVIRGGAGNDKIKGSAGNDVLTGCPGYDMFGFTAPLDEKTNVYTITDFNPEQDTIDLSNKVFTKLGAANRTMNSAFFTIGDRAKDWNDYIIYNPKTGGLFYDADGSGPGAAVKFAQLSPNLKMTASDFYIINEEFEGEAPAPAPSGRTIAGTSGNDRLYGTSGDDVIRGGAGNDKIK